VDAKRQARRIERQLEQRNVIIRRPCFLSQIYKKSHFRRRNFNMESIHDNLNLKVDLSNSRAFAFYGFQSKPLTSHLPRPTIVTGRTLNPWSSSGDHQPKRKNNHTCRPAVACHQTHHLSCITRTTQNDKTVPPTLAPKF
jgi:hypothetical protein